MSIITKLEALERSATPGPWRIHWAPQPEDLSDPQAVGIAGPEHFGFGGNDMNDIVGIDGEHGVSTYDNAELIVLARNAMPAILRVLEAADSVDENAMPSGGPYPVVPAKDINELHDALDALRALDIKGGAA